MPGTGSASAGVKPLEGQLTIDSSGGATTVAFRVDVPITPKGLSVKVSGKPDREAVLHQTFSAVISSMGSADSESSRLPVIIGAIALILVAAALVSRRLRRRPGGK